MTKTHLSGTSARARLAYPTLFPDTATPWSRSRAGQSGPDLIPETPANLQGYLSRGCGARRSGAEARPGPAQSAAGRDSERPSAYSASSVMGRIGRYIAGKPAILWHSSSAERAGGLEKALAEGGTMVGKTDQVTAAASGGTVACLPRSRKSSGRRALTLVFGLVLAIRLSDSDLGPAALAAPRPVQTFYVPFPEDQFCRRFRLSEPGRSRSNCRPARHDLHHDRRGRQQHHHLLRPVGERLRRRHRQPAEPLQRRQPGRHADLGRRQHGQRRASGRRQRLINAGTVIILNNSVDTTTRQSVIDFDGRDKFAATKTIAVTRTSWASGSGTLWPGASRCSTPATGEPTTAPRWARTSLTQRDYPDVRVHQPGDHGRRGRRHHLCRRERRRRLHRCEAI